MRDDSHAHAAELYAETVGWELGLEQRAVLSEMLATDADGRWAAREYRVDVDRALLDVRALAGLFVFDEDVMWLSSRRRGVETFRRLRGLVEGAPLPRGKVRRVSATNGAQRIDTHDGRRLLFVSRPHGGRGVSADCLIVDGPPVTAEDGAAVWPSVVGRPNPQLVWTSKSEGEGDGAADAA